MRWWSLTREGLLTLGKYVWNSAMCILNLVTWVPERLTDQLSLVRHWALRHNLTSRRIPQPSRHSDPNLFLSKILQYLETPQWVAKMCVRTSVNYNYSVCRFVWLSLFVLTLLVEVLLWLPCSVIQCDHSNTVRLLAVWGGSELHPSHSATGTWERHSFQCIRIWSLQVTNSVMYA